MSDEDPCKGFCSSLSRFWEAGIKWWPADRVGYKTISRASIVPWICCCMTFYGKQGCAWLSHQKYHVLPQAYKTVLYCYFIQYWELASSHGFTLHIWKTRMCLVFTLEVPWASPRIQSALYAWWIPWWRKRCIELSSVSYCAWLSKDE